MVKISQFEFLGTTEKNIFAYNLFLSLNISDFIFFFFFGKIATPPLEKSHPLFPSNTKLRSCQATTFWKFDWRFSYLEFSYLEFTYLKERIKKKSAPLTDR